MKNKTIDQDLQVGQYAWQKQLSGLVSSSQRLLSLLDSDRLMDDLVGLLQEETLSAFAGLYRCRKDETTWQLISGCKPGSQTSLEGLEESWIHPADQATLPHDEEQDYVPVDEMTAASLHLAQGTRMVEIIDHPDARLAFVVRRDLQDAPYSLAERDAYRFLVQQARLKMENSFLRAELARYARQAEETEQALGQTVKMAAVGRLMASVAHEVNNPLQAVGTCLDLASRKELPRKKRQEYLMLARNELERLGLTLQRMLEFYRPGTLERLPIFINPVIERVLTLVQQQLVDQKIRVHLTLGENLPRVVAARDLIQQVFFNLMVNAIEAMPEGGDLSITSWASGGDIIVQIEDSGTGIAEEYRERMFEPFMSTKPGGSGLGLSVSYGIIESHGGHLRLVDNQAHQPPHTWAGCPGDKKVGACFEVSLPVERRFYVQEAA